MNRLNIYAFADEASGQIDRQIAAMQRNGLQGLEIRGVDGQNISDITVEKAREVRQKLDDAGLCVWSMGSPIGKIDIVNGDFPAHLEKLQNNLLEMEQQQAALQLELLEVEEIRTTGTKKYRGRHRSERYDCIPHALLEEIVLACPEDYAAHFLPDAARLPDPFDAAQFGKVLGVRGRAIYGVLGVLTDLRAASPDTEYVITAPRSGQPTASADAVGNGQRPMRRIIYNVRM